jgi:hypothetical protein
LLITEKGAKIAQEALVARLFLSRFEGVFEELDELVVA